MPERKHARGPEAVLARPLSLASYPVATGRPRPGQQRPRARVRLIEEQIAGARGCFGATPLVGELPRSNGQTTAWPAAPSRTREADRRANRGGPRLFWRDPSRWRATP